MLNETEVTNVSQAGPRAMHQTPAMKAALKHLEPMNERERKCNLRKFRLDPKQAREVAGFAYLLLGDKARDVDPEKLFKAVLNGLLEVGLIKADRKKIDKIPLESLEEIQDAMFLIS